MGLSEKAKKARALYMRNYRKENEKKIREYHAEWRKENPEALKRHQNTYWEKKYEEYKEVK